MFLMNALPTDQPTDTAYHRDATTHLKTSPSRPIRCDVLIVKQMRYPTDLPTDQPTNHQTQPGGFVAPKKTVFALFQIGDIFLQTYAISKRRKLGMPDTTQIKDLSKGFIGITNFTPFFIRYSALWF